MTKVSSATSYGRGDWGLLAFSWLLMPSLCETVLGTALDPTQLRLAPTCAEPKGCKAPKAELSVDTGHSLGPLLVRQRHETRVRLAQHRRRGVVPHVVAGPDLPGPT